MSSLFALSAVLANADLSEVIGTAVGVLGLGFGAFKYRGERHARAEVRELQEREQAERISAWAGRRANADEGRRVFAHNASPQIVRDVKLWLITPASPMPEGAQLPHREPTARRAVLEPDDTLEHLIPANAMRGNPLAERPPVVLAFSDAEGRAWIRASDGRLRRRASG